MRYYLYRVKKSVADQLDTRKSIPLDFLPPDCTNAINGDKILIYVSETLTLFGTYVLTKETFILEKEFSEKTLRDIWKNFDCVQTVTPNTSRLFKKKMREITQTEYEAAISQLQA